MRWLRGNTWSLVSRTRSAGSRQLSSGHGHGPGPEEIPEPPSTFATVGAMGAGAFGAVAIAAIGVFGVFKMAFWVATETGRSLNATEPPVGASTVPAEPAASSLQSTVLPVEAPEAAQLQPGASSELQQEQQPRQRRWYQPW